MFCCRLLWSRHAADVAVPDVDVADLDGEKKPHSPEQKQNFPFFKSAGGLGAFAQMFSVFLPRAEIAEERRSFVQTRVFSRFGFFEVILRCLSGHK